MKIGNKEVKEIQVTLNNGELVASITDEDVIGRTGYTITKHIVDQETGEKLFDISAPMKVGKKERIRRLERETSIMKEQISDLQSKVQQLRDAAVLGKMPEF